MFLTSYQLLMKTRRNLLSDGVNKLINGNLSGHCGSRQMVRFGVVALVVHNALRNNNLKKLFYHNWIEQWLKDALYSEIIKYYSFCWLFWIPTIHRKFQSTRGAKFALVKVKKKKQFVKKRKEAHFHVQYRAESLRKHYNFHSRNGKYTGKQKNFTCSVFNFLIFFS